MRDIAADGGKDNGVELRRFAASARGGGAVLVALLVAACQPEGAAPSQMRLDYTLTDTRPGTFDSRNPGQPSPLERLRGRSAEELAQLLGRPSLDRVDGLARTQRYQSDACSLFVHLYQDGGTWRVRHADAYDTKLRTIGADQCAGSVAAQKRVA